MPCVDIDHPSHMGIRLLIHAYLPRSRRELGTRARRDGSGASSERRGRHGLVLLGHRRPLRVLRHHAAAAHLHTRLQRRLRQEHAAALALRPQAHSPRRCRCRCHHHHPCSLQPYPPTNRRHAALPAAQLRRHARHGQSTVLRRPCGRPQLQKPKLHPLAPLGPWPGCQREATAAPRFPPEAAEYTRDRR